MIFKEWTVYASLSATPPTPLDPLAFYLQRSSDAQIHSEYSTHNYEALCHAVH
jgi:hypothetical protein